MTNIDSWAFCVVDTILLAMDGKDIRQRFVGLQHQIHSHQDDKSPQDDEKRRSSPLRYILSVIPKLWEQSQFA